MNLLNILITCINYNTDDRLKSFVTSLYNAKKKYNEVINVDVIIGDNSENVNDLSIYQDKSFRVFHINNNKNCGYIGGVTSALKIANIDITSYDYFIISNVDLCVSEDFFECLSSIENDSDLGWIAPSIISEKEKRDRNPKILERPSRRKMIYTSLMFKYPLIHKIYFDMIYKRRIKALPTNNTRGTIYAGHGSFMIFTKSFIKRNTNFDFPSFLFGEEIYFAELNRLSDLKVVYNTSIKVYDFDHASTSKMKKSEYYKMNYRSLKILIKKYF